MCEIVKTNNLSKQYGKTRALAGLDCVITEHSITGLVGRNGSGKTTLMKILAGVLDKTGGAMSVFGEEPMDNLPVLRRLVYTYHNVPHDPNISLSAVLYGYKMMFPGFDAGFADRLMKFFELSGKMKYKSLSQGMASVFNFLCALACRAELTMLDEPVLGMDVTVRKSVYEILLRDYTEHPRTFIVSSHLLSEIEGLISDILLIEQGAAALHGPIDDIRHGAYRVDGIGAEIEKYTAGKNVIARKSNELTHFAVIYEPLTKETIKTAESRGIKVSPVRAEDLCVYLTRRDKEDELECLWTL